MADNVIQMPRGRTADSQAIRDLAVGITQYLQAGAGGNPALPLTALALATVATLKTAGIPREVMMEHLGRIFDAIPTKGPANG